MKICLPHWDQLKAAITARDLMRFVSNDGTHAIEKVEAQLTPGVPALEGFDPLLNANFAIWSNALNMGGLYLMSPDENGNEYCPICEAVKHGMNDADWWINQAAEEQLERAREHGLLPKASTN